MTVRGFANLSSSLRAKQSSSHEEGLIAWSQVRLKETGIQGVDFNASSFRAFHAGRLDCRGASAPRNDGERFPPSSPRHCERSEAIQGPREKCQFHPRGSAEAGAKIAMTGLRFPLSSRRHCAFGQMRAVTAPSSVMVSALSDFESLIVTLA